MDAAFLEIYLEDLLPGISTEVIWITEEGGAEGWDRSYLSRTFENSYQAERNRRQKIHLFNHLWSFADFVWMCLYLYLQNWRVCKLGARQKGSLLPDQFDWIHTREKNKCLKPKAVWHCWCSNGNWSLSCYIRKLNVSWVTMPTNETFAATIEKTFGTL